MAWWDRHLKRKLEDEGVKVKMYSRYVDDINIVYEKMDIKVEGKAGDKTVMTFIIKLLTKSTRVYRYLLTTNQII